MPRGVPKSGMRMTAKRILNQQGLEVERERQFVELNESDEEIDARIAERFAVMDELVSMAIAGENRSTIISGPAGLGKSYGVEKKLEQHDPEGLTSTCIKGFSRATGLYKKLYQFRFPGNVIVLDDCDSVFRDEDALNILKAACDTTEVRHLSWGAETKMVDEEGMDIPTHFVFEGAIIFITNKDFAKEVELNTGNAVHFEALMSRSFYIDLAMKNRRDYIIRIKQVVRQGLFVNMGLTQHQAHLAISYIETHRDQLQEVSIRCANKLAALIKTREHWERMARVTLLRNAGR